MGRPILSQYYELCHALLSIWVLPMQSYVYLSVMNSNHWPLIQGSRFQ